MAMKPLRPCRHAGCRELTRDGWCQKHKPKYQRRDSAQWHGLYSLSIWTKRLRPQQLLLNPWCQCPTCDALRETGRPARATVVDHIVPHRGNMALFTDPNNLQSLCKRCHDRKTMMEQRENPLKVAKTLTHRD